jgi:hypothetical protein
MVAAWTPTAKGNQLSKVVHVIPCRNRDNGSQWWQFPELPGVGPVCSAMRWCDNVSDPLVLDDSDDAVADPT